MKLEAKHWAVVAAMGASLAAQLNGVHNWSETLTPGFVSGLLGMIATTLSAMFIGAPGAEAELQEAKWGPRSTAPAPAPSEDKRPTP